MEGRQRERRHLPTTSAWARNTLGSTETPSFQSETLNALKEPPQSSHLPDTPTSSASTNLFRVPSPTSSDEEEIRAAEDRLLTSKNPPKIISVEEKREDAYECPSRLGDSSSLFATPPSIAHFTFYSSPPSANMVVEREPPKSHLSPQKANDHQAQSVLGKVPQRPEFGKASPLRNQVESGPFVIPKPHQARPEHHRPAQPTQISYQQPAYPSYQQPPVYPSNKQQPYTFGPQHGQFAGGQQPPSKPHYPISSGPDVVVIPKPMNFPTWSTKPAPAPLFSSKGGGVGFTAVNPLQNTSNFIDLTTGQPLLDDQFGSIDPYDYIDTGKANENIKALLEGAFEDEEDKPRTRGRKKKVEAAVERLTDKLQDLEVKNEAKKEDEAEQDEEEEEEEEDDGTVEGLKVKLLPHQVDGVAWMKDKEIGVKKKNGVLPKGGILADDVSLELQYVMYAWLIMTRWVLAKPSSQSR